MTATVEVLLATFNGARFLREQIDSVLAQTYPQLTILARDDGSSDETPAILAQYAEHHSQRFKVLAFDGPSGGAKQNFGKLLRASSAPYVAFCDQDDVWLPDKIAVEMQAMGALERRHSTMTPLLVFTDLWVVGPSLERKDASFWANQRLDPKAIERFNRIIVQNVVTGCTALLNRALATMCAEMPAEAYMHDWWAAMLASAFGASASVPRATVLYRQHTGNVLGAARAPRGLADSMPKWRRHEERRRQWEILATNAGGMLRVYGRRLDPGRRGTLEAILRIEHSTSPAVRVWTFLRFRFFFSGSARQTLALLWYVWDMNFSKRQQVPATSKPSTAPPP